MIATKVPMEDKIALDFDELLTEILYLCNGVYENYVSGSKKVVDIMIWNDQVVTVNFGEWSKKDPSIINGEGPQRIISAKNITRAICDLVDNGVPFKTDSGTGDEVLCLEFEIND